MKGLDHGPGARRPERSQGDFRDWTAIRAWGDEITANLVGPTRVVRMFNTISAAGATAPQGGTT
jgi:hypothetical protein